MSLLKIKGGAVVSKQVVIAAAAVNAANTLGLDVDIVITSGTDGTHKRNSLHYRGRALDLRTKTLGDDKYLWAETVKRRLGKGYDVILESDHLHVEWDPK